MKIRYIYISKVLIVITVLFVTLIFNTELKAQNSDTLRYCIETENGNIFIGYLESSDSSVFLINTNDYGIVKIKANRVYKMYQITNGDKSVKNYWHSSIQSARYFWAPNGYGLKKGEGYYQNYWILFNQVSYGFNDYFSAGFGMMPLFIFGGTPTPIWITPKFSLPIVANKFNVGVGGLFATVVGEGGTSFGLAYGTATYGSRNKNISVGLGWGYAGEDWASTPLVNISGIVRIGRKGNYFMTENYFVNVGTDEFMALLSFGGRSLISSVSIDYGLFIPVYMDIETFFAIPWLGITIPFKSKNKK